MGQLRKPSWIRSMRMIPLLQIRLSAMQEHRRLEAQARLIRLALLVAGSVAGLLCGWALAELIDKL